MNNTQNSKLNLSLKTKFWTMGEDEIITPSSKNLSSIMNALILLNGKLKTSHSMEIKDYEWQYPTRACAVVFIIELPEGLESSFTNMTGFSLFEPQVIQLN